MQGDLVLFAAKAGSFPDWLIARFSKGPYVHVEIDMGDGTCIGEHGSGITKSPCKRGKGYVTVNPKVLSPNAVIEVGLDWVRARYAEAAANQEAHEYGWWDIATEALKLFGSRTVRLSKLGEWDCSDFATRYLLEAHAAGPLGDAALDPGSVSPNDIARAYGVLLEGE